MHVSFVIWRRDRSESVGAITSFHSCYYDDPTGAEEEIERDGREEHAAEPETPSSPNDAKHFYAHNNKYASRQCQRYNVATRHQRQNHRTASLPSDERQQTLAPDRPAVAGATARMHFVRMPFGELLFERCVLFAVVGACDDPPKTNNDKNASHRQPDISHTRD